MRRGARDGLAEIWCWVLGGEARNAGQPPRPNSLRRARRSTNHFVPEPPIVALMAEAGTRPLRVRQAADLLGVSPATVRRWATAAASSAGVPKAASAASTLTTFWGTRRRPGFLAAVTHADAERRYQLLLERVSSWRRRSTSKTSCNLPPAVSAPRSTPPTATSTGSTATTGSSASPPARTDASTASGQDASSPARLELRPRSRSRIAARSPSTPSMTRA